MIEWALLTAALFAAAVVLWRLTGRIERIVDRLRRPYVYPVQREYQRYRRTLARHAPSEPYTLSTTRVVDDD